MSPAAQAEAAESEEGEAGGFWCWGRYDPDRVDGGADAQCESQRATIGRDGQKIGGRIKCSIEGTARLVRDEREAYVGVCRVQGAVSGLEANDIPVKVDHSAYRTGPGVQDIIVQEIGVNTRSGSKLGDRLMIRVASGASYIEIQNLRGCEILSVDKELGIVRCCQCVLGEICWIGKQPIVVDSSRR